MLRVRDKEEVKKRLLSFIQEGLSKEECWDFRGSLSRGYGRIKVNGKVEGAHRVSYAIFKGDIPDGQYVCHKCDNPSCINPDHLFIGTHSDNMKDAYDKGRLNVPKGKPFKPFHKPKNRNLTQEEAEKLKMEIWKKKKGKISTSFKQIAKNFNVKYQTVKDISAGRAYRNVFPPLY